MHLLAPPPELHVVRMGIEPSRTARDELAGSPVTVSDFEIENPLASAGLSYRPPLSTQVPPSGAAAEQRCSVENGAAAVPAAVSSPVRAT